MSPSRRFALALLAAPLTLALAACGDEADGEAALVGEPVAAAPAPAGSSWSEQAVRTEAGGWQVGNPDAPIKLVEYGSLTCPACGQFSVDGAEALQRDYIDTGRVSFEFRSFMIHGVPDLVLTRMLECGAVTSAVPLADQVWQSMMAGTPPFDTTNGAALEQANALPEAQRLVALADAAGTLDFFAARGISKDQAATCLADFEAAQALSEKTQAAAEGDSVTRTPTFFINGRQIEESSWTGVEAALQRAGAREE
ncbi:thioredoxin domain-containing protein [Erythrobacter arachoides]|uniref:Thioredoxin domain-containing protein n=1 Tax=Aurantiacibacter arachoides TaxID=1850444 RepID=A0A845A1C7_9SPHN|nr:thioredoxin domain-containing protein [Aurantiacibacter arachoides]MXO93728.1 thioredoxin domain-containing protein [Aurantiacibacter arachoides]GGD47108.1 thiol-disulfide oxidoreductase [Aurantiacibacter arachoides]